MSGKRYTDEFKIEEVKQVTERGYKVAVVVERLGVSYKICMIGLPETASLERSEKGRFNTVRDSAAQS